MADSSSSTDSDSSYESTESDHAFIDDDSDTHVDPNFDPDFDPRKYSSGSSADQDTIQFIGIDKNADDIRVCYVDRLGVAGAPVNLQDAYEALWILREYIKETLFEQQKNNAD